MGIVDFLFPRRCLGCGQTGGYFCPDCLNFVSLKENRICPVCLKPSVGGLTHPRCRTPHSLDGLTAVFAYKGLMKKAVQRLKYQFISDLAEDLVEVFLSLCGEDKAFAHFCSPRGEALRAKQEKVIFVPIPLHPARKRWRGFNQAELLGKMIASNLGLTFLPDLLIRVKKTKPQIELKKEERKKNIKGAFELNFNHRSLVTNHQLILFDDVWTSGSTLKEAGKVLKAKGAEKVWGLTLAR